MLNISAIITHPISHVSLCFLLLVTNLITLDTVQPSEKFSVRYFTSSQTSNITSFPQLNYSLIQKAPNIQKQYLIIFSVTDLFYAHFPLKPFKKIYFSARSHKCLPFSIKQLNQYLLKYTTSNLVQNSDSSTPIFSTTTKVLYNLQSKEINKIYKLTETSSIIKSQRISEMFNSNFFRPLTSDEREILLLKTIQDFINRPA
jgi:hypothetical protein